MLGDQPLIRRVGAAIYKRKLFTWVCRKATLKIRARKQIFFTVRKLIVFRVLEKKLQLCESGVGYLLCHAGINSYPRDEVTGQADVSQYAAES